MGYERMWKQLKEDIEQQGELSNEINVSKILKRIKDIEEAEKQYWQSEELLF